MHKEVYEITRKFINNYLNKNKNLTILEIGSQDINGSYKSLFKNSKWKYVGADIVKGPNVDVVSKPHKLPFEPNSFDVVISSNVFEHVQAPWLLIKEISRVIKKGGLVCFTTPTNVGIHDYPLDCWRIMPDGMRYLLEIQENFKILKLGIDKGQYEDLYVIAKTNKKTNSFYLKRKTFLEISLKILYPLSNKLRKRSHFYKIFLDKLKEKSSFLKNLPRRRPK